MLKSIPAILLLTILFFTNKVSSQNIDRDNLTIHFIEFPLKKFPDTTETYFTEIREAKGRFGNNFGGPYDNVNIKLDGYYRLPSASDADIVITAGLLNGLSYQGVKLLANTYTYKKDKNSPEIKYTAYTYSILMTAPQVFYKIQTGKNIAIEESTIGGDTKREIFGSSNYSDFYRSEVELANAWRQVQSYKLASWEEEYYKNAISVVPIICQTYCLNPMNMTFSVKYVKEKKTNIYDDLRQAKILLFESADYYKTDSIALINKLIQPNYEKRQETIKKAIVIWEKALEEADFDNKKARID